MSLNKNTRKKSVTKNKYDDGEKKKKRYSNQKTTIYNTGIFVLLPR